MITANSSEELENLTSEFDETVWSHFPEFMNNVKVTVEKLWLNYSEIKQFDILEDSENPKSKYNYIEFRSPNRSHPHFNRKSSSPAKTIFAFNQEKIVIKYFPEFKNVEDIPTGFIQLQPREYNISDINLDRKLRDFMNQAIKNNDILDKTYNF